MWEKARIYDLKKEFKTASGQIVSELAYDSDSVSLFGYGFGQKEDISRERIFAEMLYYVLEGSAEMILEGEPRTIGEGESIIVEEGHAREVRAITDLKLITITLKEEGSMINNLDKEKIFKLVDAIPYEENKIVSKTLVKNDALNMTLLSFDGKQALSTHSAPGDALVIALDGEANVTIKDNHYVVKAGDSLVMPANIPHSVVVEKAYKMLLIVSKA